MSNPVNIGPHSHARWLNLASRICKLWCSNHELSNESSQSLKVLVEFVVGVYSPTWFDIKVKHQ